MPGHGRNCIEPQGMSNTRAAPPCCQTLNLSRESIHRFRRKQCRLNRESVLFNNFAQSHFYRAAFPGAIATVTFSGVICSIDFPLTCTKLNSRAASNAFTASFTFERAMKFPKNTSSSACSTATTQPRYLDTGAERASGTDNPTPSFTASGAQRYSRSQTDPSLAL